MIEADPRTDTSLSRPPARDTERSCSQSWHANGVRDGRPPRRGIAPEYRWRDHRDPAGAMRTSLRPAPAPQVLRLRFQVHQIMASPISPSSLGSGSGRPESESRNDWFLSDLPMKCTAIYQGGGSGSGSGTAGVRRQLDLGPPSRPSILLPRSKIVEADHTFPWFSCDENEF